MTKPKIKICGITTETEVEYLNRYRCDYCGFVFYPKSKRNIELMKAEELRKRLLPSIKAVAVTVNPDTDFLRKIENAGFDVIQIHNGKKHIKKHTEQIEIWEAVNLETFENIQNLETVLPAEGVLIDAAAFGSGKTSDWSSLQNRDALRKVLKNRKFILAGGLNVENVRRGIELFQPDVVDVSSGVEDQKGKSEIKIKDFIERVRQTYE